MITKKSLALLMHYSKILYKYSNLTKSSFASSNNIYLKENIEWVQIYCPLISIFVGTFLTKLSA